MVRLSGTNVTLQDKAHPPFRLSLAATGLRRRRLWRPRVRAALAG
jgi:hypothetical protein